MKSKGHEDNSVDHSPLTRFIDRLVSTFLFVVLLALFIVIFRRVFGTSEIAWIAGLVICCPFAGIAYSVIDFRRNSEIGSGHANYLEVLNKDRKDTLI